MNKAKPRGPTPSLIGGANGRPTRVSVLKKSECKRCHAPFAAGQTCIAIPQLGTGYSTTKRICDECFQGILLKTEQDLTALKTI
jgi:hypothetical protein